MSVLQNQCFITPNQSFFVKSTGTNPAAMISTLQTNNLQYSIPGSSTYIKQPVIQWGVATGATGGTGTQTVTLPQAYTSQSSFVPTVTMADSPAAQVFASTTSVSSFMLGWQSGGTGSHSFYWNTMGN